MNMTMNTYNQTEVKKSNSTTLVPYEVDTALGADQYLFATAPRKNREGKVLGEGLKAIFDKPKWLSSPAMLEETEALVYTYGAEELLKEFIRKEIKDKNLTVGSTLTIPTLADIKVMRESTGTKLLTKASIEEFFEAYLEESLIAKFISKGFDDNKVTLGTKTILLKLQAIAAPNAKFSEEEASKLIALIKSAPQQTAVSNAMIARLERKEEDTSIDEFL